MPKGTNTKHIGACRKAALVALRTHDQTKRRGQPAPSRGFQDGFGEPPEDLVTDLLVDLMHLCGRRDMPEFNACLRRAYSHHAAEAVPAKHIPDPFRALAEALDRFPG